MQGLETRAQMYWQNRTAATPGIESADCETGQTDSVQAGRSVRLALPAEGRGVASRDGSTRVPPFDGRRVKRICISTAFATAFTGQLSLLGPQLGRALPLDAVGWKPMSASGREERPEYRMSNSGPDVGECPGRCAEVGSGSRWLYDVPTTAGRRQLHAPCRTESHRIRALTSLARPMRCSPAFCGSMDGKVRIETR